jgi:hypothetical protein
MLISSLDHAAQAVHADADARFYDDVGCLATDGDARVAGHRLFVHTRGGAWTDVNAARFLRGTGVRTPMSYDIVALTETEAGKDSRVLTWEQLVGSLDK